jgi:hypothetical protein
MGTRGLYGFHYKGKYYIFYCQYDSYPEGLGVNLAFELQEVVLTNTTDSWKQMIEKFKNVLPTDVPTEEDVANLAKYTDLGVSKKTTADWYCLTRGCQGSFVQVLEAGYCVRYEEKPMLDLWIEYCYIADFDENKFIIYSHSGTVAHDFDKLDVFLDNVRKMKLVLQNVF